MVERRRAQRRGVMRQGEVTRRGGSRFYNMAIRRMTDQLTQTLAKLPCSASPNNFSKSVPFSARA